jgi:DNA-binding SARP family transcriptional activator
LLGSFYLAYDQAPLEVIDSPIQQSLLTFLLIHQDTPQPRQRLAFHLWPDTPEAQAQANLRTLLVRLRRMWPEVDRFVGITPQTLPWRPDSDFSLDVNEFEEAVRRAETAGAARDVLAAQADLERAGQLDAAT